MPLYQRCVHLGCRVPFCAVLAVVRVPVPRLEVQPVPASTSSDPAPRGLDRFTMEIVDGNVIVDTSNIVLGPPRGTNTTEQPQEGPYCVATG